MRLKPTRRLVGVALVPALLFGFAACGSESSDATDSSSETSSDATSDDGSSDDAAEDAGADATDDAEAATDDAAEDQGEDAGEAGDDAGDDAIQPAAGEEVPSDTFVAAVGEGVAGATTAHISMTQEAQGQSVAMEGDVDYSTTPPKLALEVSAAGQTMEVRLADGKMFMNMGEMSQNKFMEIPLDDPNSPAGDLDALTNSLNFTDGLKQFEAGLQKVVYLGEEEIEGEDSPKYEMTVDPSKVDLNLGFAPTDMKTTTYNLWLDDNDRMRRLEVDLGGEVGTMTMDITNWGEPVDIQAPAANEITTTPAS